MCVEDSFLGCVFCKSGVAVPCWQILTYAIILTQRFPKHGLRPKHGSWRVENGSRRGYWNLSKRTFFFSYFKFFPNSVIDWIIASYAFHLASSY